MCGRNFQGLGPRGLQDSCIQSDKKNIVFWHRDKLVFKTLNCLNLEFLYFKFWSKRNHPYLKLGYLFVCLCIPNHVLCTVQKLLVKRGTQASFCDVPTHNEKVMDFWVIFGFKKLKKYFYIYFGSGNGTWHTSLSWSVGLRV